MSRVIDFYEILGVRPNSDEVVIQGAYRALIRKYHPDTNKSSDATAKCAMINEAYATLSEPTRRSQYDRILAETRSKSAGKQQNPPPPPPPPPPNEKQTAGSDSQPKAAKNSRSSLGIIIVIVLGIASMVLFGSPRNVPVSEKSTKVVGINEATGTERPNSEINDTAIPEINTASNAALQDATVNGVSPIVDPKSLPATLVNFANIEKAARSFDRVLSKRGISGARAYSEGCHRAVSISPTWGGADECAAFDFAARYIDQGMVTVAGITANNYFAFKSENQSDDYEMFGVMPYTVNERLEKIRKYIGPVVTEEIENRLSREASQRASKSQPPIDKSNAQANFNRSD